MSALGARRAGLVGEIALWHPHVIGTKDTTSGTRVRLREHRDRCDTTLGADRSQPKPRHERRIIDIGPALIEMPETRDDFERRMRGDLPNGWREALATLKQATLDEAPKIASRVSSPGNCSSDCVSSGPKTPASPRSTTTSSRATCWVRCSRPG